MYVCIYVCRSSHSLHAVCKNGMCACMYCMVYICMVMCWQIILHVQLYSRFIVDMPHSNLTHKKREATLQGFAIRDLFDRSL